MQDILAVIQLLVFLGYAYFIKKRYGVLSSVSASTYSLQGMQRWIFFAVLGVMGAINLFMGMGGYGFLATMGIWFAGVTIEHRKSNGVDDELHTIGTVTAIAATFLGFILLYSLWLPAILLGAGIWYIVRSGMPNRIWYIEITAMALACLGYLLLP